jgi:hypothetical protein
MTRSFLTSSLSLAVLAGGALVACAPEYRSGITGCASGKCPPGFVCVSKVCYLPSDRPDGVGPTGRDAGPGGSDSGAPTAPDASPTVTRESCRAPTPLFCEARGEVPPSCQDERLDCATAIRCPDGVRACVGDAVATCQYRADYCQDKDTSCNFVSHPVRCGALGDIGPGCWTPGTDCGTRRICGDSPYSRACAAGQTVDCSYRVSGCTPPQACTDPDFPKICPPMGVIGPDDCWSADVDCNTRVYCEEDRRVKACPAGSKVECKYAVHSCVPPAACDSDFPQMCPPLNAFGPGCWSANTDCSTRTLCDTDPEVRSCRAGFKVDCRYRADYCLPAAGDACTDPMRPERCPAMGDLGPRCLTARPPGAAPHDCNGRKVCGNELNATVCPMGSTVDCSRPFEQRCVSQTPAPRPDGGAPPVADAGRG